MKHNGDKGIYIEFFFVIVAIMLGFICFLLAEHNSPLLSISTIVGNFVILFVCIFFIKTKYKDENTKFVKNLISDIEKISNGERPENNQKNSSYDIDKLYDTIEGFGKTFNSRNKLKDSVISIINSISVNTDLAGLLENLLPKVIEGTGSNWGAFYLYNSLTEKYELKSSIGFSKNIYNEFDIALGEGFIGGSAQSESVDIINDIPDDTVYITRTFLGKIKPRGVMTIPITENGERLAVILLSSVVNYSEYNLETAKMIKIYIGSAVANGIAYERNQRLRNELLFQNQLIQNMNEELEMKVERRSKYLNKILDSIVDYAIISMDEDGIVNLWNEGAVRIIGCSKEDALGAHISEAYSERDRRAVYRRLEIAKLEGKFDELYKSGREDGSPTLLHTVITAIYNEHGEILGYTNITRDTTEAKLKDDKISYLNYLGELLLADEEKGLIIINSEGYILNLSSRAAEICESSLMEMEGTFFEFLFEKGEVFKSNFSSCIEDLTKTLWTDTLKNDKGSTRVNISLTGMKIPNSEEKIAVAYIERN